MSCEPAFESGEPWYRIPGLGSAAAALGSGRTRTLTGLPSSFSKTRNDEERENAGSSCHVGVAVYMPPTAPGAVHGKALVFVCPRI